MGRPTRRQFTAQQKYKIVMQLQRGEKQLTALAREHGVDHTTIYRWREQMQAAALEAFHGLLVAQRRIARGSMQAGSRPSARIRSGRPT